MLEAAAGGGGSASWVEGRRRAADVRLRLPQLGGVLGPEHARPVTVLEGGHAEPILSSLLFSCCPLSQNTRSSPCELKQRQLGIMYYYHYFIIYYCQ